MDYLWVGLGGFLGANARYALGTWIVQRIGLSFPWHTLLINVTGSLAIGAILVLLTERLVADPAWRLFLVVGLLGGYTTFWGVGARSAGGIVTLGATSGRVLLPP